MNNEINKLIFQALKNRPNGLTRKELLIQLKYKYNLTIPRNTLYHHLIYLQKIGLITNYTKKLNKNSGRPHTFWILKSNYIKNYNYIGGKL